jgi:hypothetical protein
MVFYGGQTAMKVAGKTYEPVTHAGAGHGLMRSGEQPDASKENAEARTQAWARLKKIMSSLSQGARQGVARGPGGTLFYAE